MSHVFPWDKDNILYANTSEGGQTSAWGVANFTEKVLNENPDLLVIHFGMNDGNGSAVSAQAYKANIQAMIASAKAHNPNIEIILVSPMLPNPEVKVTAGNQDSYEAVLNELCETGVIVAPVTSIYKVLMERKLYLDDNFVTDLSDALSIALPDNKAFVGFGGFSESFYGTSDNDF